MLVSLDVLIDMLLSGGDSLTEYCTHSERFEMGRDDKHTIPRSNLYIFPPMPFPESQPAKIGQRW